MAKDKKPKTSKKSKGVESLIGTTAVATEHFRHLTSNESKLLITALVNAATLQNHAQIDANVLINLEMNDQDAKSRLVDAALEAQKKKQALETLSSLVMEGKIRLSAGIIIPDLI